MEVSFVDPSSSVPAASPSTVPTGGTETDVAANLIQDDDDSIYDALEPLLSKEATRLMAVRVYRQAEFRGCNKDKARQEAVAFYRFGERSLSRWITQWSTLGILSDGV